MDMVDVYRPIVLLTEEQGAIVNSGVARIA